MHKDLTGKELILISVAPAAPNNLLRKSTHERCDESSADGPNGMTAAEEEDGDEEEMWETEVGGGERSGGARSSSVQKADLRRENKFGEGGEEEEGED